MKAAARVVIVGASIGGLTAAETLRQEGFGGEILLIGEEPHLPYTRPPLSKQVLLGEWEPAEATIRTAAELEGLSVQLRTQCSATGLDVRRRVLHTSQGSMPFDELIIATGTEPRRHPVLPGAPSLRTMEDALHLRDGMRASHRVAVIGSGILGSEIASAARKYDAETLLIGRSGALGFGGVGTQLSARLIQHHLDHGVDLALHTEVRHATSLENGGAELTLGDGRTQRFDLVVAVIGGTPSTDWLASSGLDIADGVACDSDGIAAPGVSAVGDVAAWKDRATARHIRVEHQSNAIEQAIAVASRIAQGATAAPPVPLFWSEIHGARIHAYGRFAPDQPLLSNSTDDAPGSVLMSVDADGHVRGVVGWNAPPRDFRAARAMVAAADDTLATRP